MLKLVIVGVEFRSLVEVVLCDPTTFSPNNNSVYKKP